MKVSAIQCNDCRDIIYSRARHDFRWCTCKNCAVDGGLDYLRVVGDGFKTKALIIESTKEELYNEWNNSKDLFGLISSTDQLNEAENKAIFKFNNNHEALLCSGCRVILKDACWFSDEEMAAFQGEGELEAQYCNKCEEGTK